MDFNKVIRSFPFAIKGIKLLFRFENNARFQVLVAGVVFFLGMVLGISKREWIICIMCIMSVFAAEAFNTAIEKLCDRISLEKDEQIAHIKDLSAGAVLIICIGSVLVGAIIFIPKLLSFSN